MVQGRRGTRASRNVVRAGARTELADKIEKATSSPGRQDVVEGGGWVGFRRPESSAPPQAMGRVTEQSGGLDIQLPSMGEIRRGAIDAFNAVVDSPAIPFNRTVEPTAVIAPSAPSGPTVTRATVKGDRLNPAGLKNDEFQFGLQEKMAAEKDKAAGYSAAIRDYEQQIAELNRAALAAVQAGADDIARQYDEQIAEVEKQMADARLQLKRSMSAYEHYASQVAPAYQASVAAAVAGEEAQKEALEGRVAAAESQIESNREASVEDVEELADLIGTGAMVYDGNVDEALGEFSSMFKEAARGRIGDIDRISKAAATFATALADAEYKSDLFSNDIEKQGLEAQIKGQLDDLAEQVRKLEKDKAQAVADAMALYDPMGGFEDPDELFRFIYDSIALNGEWDLDEKDAVWAMFQDAQADGIKTRDQALAWIDEKIVSDAGWRLFDYFEGKGIDPDGMPDAHKKLLADIVTGDEAARNSAIGVLQRLYQSADLNAIDMLDGLFDTRQDYDHFLDAYDAYETHVDEWEKRKYVPVKKGSSAPNNWANRNAPQYVARRNIGVPTFAKAFQAAFGKTGTGREYIGGVSKSLQGVLRDPSRVGGGKAANSDHQSGGALDLYADTVEELEAIERWASQQPGVSYVTYSGNKYHETGKAGGASSGVAGRGHVHVSLLLGYWG